MEAILKNDQKKVVYERGYVNGQFTYEIMFISLVIRKLQI